MKEKYSLAKKICAVILSALMIIGTIPIAMATDSELTEPAPTAESSATPDEAEETTVEPESDFSVNSDAKLVESNGVTYILGENLETLIVKTELPGSIAEELSEENYDNLLVDMKLGSAEEPMNIKDYCGFEAKDGKLKVTVRLKDLFSASFQEDIYSIKISYNNEGTPIDLYSKSFTLVTKAPVISDILYDGKDTTAWVGKSVEVTFKVNSMSPVTVKYDNKVIAGAGNSYSFKADENKKYKIEAVDLFDKKAETETAEIKIDTNPPSASKPEFYDKNGEQITVWYNDNLTVKVLLTDSESGIDKNSVKINNKSVAGDKLKDVENGVELSFVADTIQDYSITFSDVVGNSGSTIVSKEEIKIDKDATEAKDVTLKFTPAESAVEKVLNFLSFGLYSNDDINVEVLVDNAGPSPISDIKLFDGETQLSSTGEAGNTFVLEVPADQESKKFDLKVKVSDAAGNTSDFSLNESDIKTQVGEGAAEILKNKDLYEVVISKLAPSFDENGVSFEFDNKYINDKDEVYVSKDGKLTITVKEEITGLSSVSAFINGKSVLDEFDLTEEKNTEYNFNIDVDTKELSEGENTVKFVAVSNSGNYNVYEKTFYVDNTAQKLDGDISYSNENNQKWVNHDVNAVFSLEDDVEVKSVQYCKKDSDVAGTSESKLKDAVLIDDGSYEITAEEYGVYQIIVTDVLNNETKFYTDPIKIDTAPPKIGEISYNNNEWTNKPITVTFPVTDLPENAEEQSKVQRVEVDGKGINEKDKGKYAFNADHFGEYKIVAYDNAGNNSDELTIKIDKFDNIPPKITEVSFSSAKNVKKYGLYDNETVTMTAKIENVSNDAGIASPINCKNIEIREKDEKINKYQKINPVEIKEINSSTYTISYDIQTTDDIRNFTFFAKDEAGNSTENKITDAGVNLKVADTEIRKNEAFNDIIVTLEKPVIKYNDDNGFVVKFDNGGNLSEKEYQGGKVYSGKGRIETKITGGISPIDSYKTYFINMDENEIKFDEQNQNITNLKAFEPKETKTGISDDDKVTGVDVVIETPEKNELKSGKYLAAVAAENLSGNTNVLYTTIIVDNSAPTVEKFAITNWNSEGSKSANGIYSSNDLNVQVVCDDGKYSADKDKVKITLFNAENKLDGNENGDFTLEGNKSYQLRAQVVDVFGNKSEITDIKATSVTVNGEILAISPDNFEVVINKNTENISIQKLNYDFDYGNQNIYKDVEKGLITTNITNELSGLHKINVQIDGTELDNKSTNIELSIDDYSKNTSAKVTVDVSKLENRLKSGAHTIVIEAVDLCGISNKIEETFYIDKTEPEVESLSFEQPENSAFGKVLNLLSFGLYSNDTINAVVQIKDAGPSSGMEKDSISLSTKKGKEIVPKDFKEENDGAYGDRTYTITFSLSPSVVGDAESISFYNDLKLKFNDKFDNGADNVSQTPGTAKVNGKDIPLDGNFDIVSSVLAPTISNISIEGENEFVRAEDNTLWFSSNPVLTFNIDDKVSKINTFDIIVNGQSVVKYCNFDDGNNISGSGSELPLTTFNDDSEDKKVEHLKVTLDTGKIPTDLNVMREGKNTVKITAKGNNSEITSSDEFVFYVDTESPVIERFDFEDYVTQDGDNKPKENGVKNTDYGYFFKNQTVVTVTANDNISVDGSGVRFISLYTKNRGDNNLVLRGEIQAVNNQASFIIEANFKGQLYAYADDFVNNNADGKNQYTPDSVIAETKYQHDENSYIKFSKPSTSYKDISGKELYSDNVNVTFEAASKYAGIKTVEYKVEADYDTGNNISSMSEVDKNGSVAGWTVLEKDKNLATVIQKTITVSNNSNDIKVWVKVTDRSGYSTEDDITFSIDKVDPKIEVKYDVNNPNKVNGEDFYKVDRTATVTVTERNFNAKDFTEKITNTERVSPSLAAGTNWTSYTPDAANPDSTVHIAKFTFRDDGDYTFGCSFTDLVGRKAQDYGTDKFTIDQTVPKISVSYDWTSPNSYHNKQRVATITIDEHNFHAPYVKVNQIATGPDNSTSATPPAVSSWTTSGNTSTATITFADDGKYSFTVDFKDKALNDAVQDKESEFYIDTKIDKIEIVDVEDMTAYDGTIAPVINFFDNNYDTSDYSLKRIDFGKNPETVTNITPSDSSSGGFSRIVSYSDFTKIVENDGVYTLSAEIKDKAGNTESTSVLFSVNRFGSTFTILDDVTNELVTEKFYTNNAPDIVITEINVNEITNTVIQVNRDDSAQTLTSGTDYTVKSSGSKTNWHSYDYTILKKNFENEGNYVVTVSSTDHFKNVVSNRTAYKETGEGENKIDRTAPVSFVVDKTAPIVTISGIDSDQYYEEAAKAVTVTCDDANITSENLKIEFDGKVLSDYEITETDGSVEVKLQLEADGNTDDRSFKVNITDKAGNSNKDGVVEHFRLSASWLSRLLHYNLTLVIIFGAAVLVLIGLAVFFVVEKRKKNND